MLMTGYLENATLALDALSIWYVISRVTFLKIIEFIFRLQYFLLNFSCVELNDVRERIIIELNLTI